MPKAILPRVPESAVQSQGVQLLRTLGGRVYVIGHPSPNDGRSHRGTGQTPGLSDVFAIMPARIVAPGARPRLIALWWEAKGQGGRLRPEQAEFRQLCLGAELEHVVGDLDALIAWTVRFGYAKYSQFPHYRQPRAGSVTP